MERPSLAASLVLVAVVFSMQTAPGRGIDLVNLRERSLAADIEDEAADGTPVQPKIVVPGSWLTDEADRFLFLPLAVPSEIQTTQCKIMSNGESVLVVVTERPQDEPDTNAVRKYKMMIEAIKSEAGHNEAMLISKLRTWYETEDDDEVQVQVKHALDSLTQVHKAKTNPSPRIVSVPLGLLAQQAAQALHAIWFPPPADHVNATAISATGPAHALPSLRRGTVNATHVHHVNTTGSLDAGSSHASLDSSIRVGIIKESFAVAIPYPVPSDRLFVLKEPSELMVGMPLMRKSLAASGISEGGKPFVRLPIFGPKGEHLAGPKAASMKGLTNGLAVPPQGGRPQKLRRLRKK